MRINILFDRILTVKLTESEMHEIQVDIWTSICCIFLFIYKLFSICYSIHITKIEVSRTLSHIEI